MEKLNGWWDDRPGVDQPGWYVTHHDSEGEIIDDSVKIWFKIDVDQSGKGTRRSSSRCLS